MPQTTHTHIITAEEWRERSDAHRETLLTWTMPYRARRSKRQPHPVHDFLFTYYSYSMAKLETWHPPLGTAIESLTLNDKNYTSEGGLTYLCKSTISEKKLAAIRWIKTLLDNTNARPANFGCHGLHEWAMVHRGHEVRHEATLNLRLPQADIDALVEGHPICCSHYDAYRFFAPSAEPLNKLRPTFETREKNEQPACLHANMDLYKWAYRCMPYIGSDLLLETFHLALEIRAMDMRASPYDLSEWGYQPIKIETREGQLEYEELQKDFSRRAKILRRRLIDAIDHIFT